MKLLKKVLAFTLAGAMIAGMTGCGGDSKAAKKKVVIYTSMYKDIVDNMDKALEEKFPDYDIEFFQGGTGTLQAKIAAEISAGKLGCDMLMVAEPSYALELKEQNLLSPIKISNTDNLLFEYDKDGYWYPVRLSNMILAYNPEKKKLSEIPNSFDEFSRNENMKGKLSMPNPLVSGSAMATVVGLLDKYGEEYFERLGKLNVPVESGPVSVTKIETGEADVIMTLEESILKKREEEGSKLEVIYPTDGTVCVPSPIMSIVGEKSANNNLDACKEITEWFLSEEGQSHITKGWMHSVLKNSKNLPFDAKPTEEIIKNSIKVDSEKAYKQRDEIRNMFQKYITIKK